MLASGRKLFSVGVISDVQYAEIPDGVSFHGVPRYYQNSLAGLRRAVTGWQKDHVDLAIHFGDIVDGYQPKGRSLEALRDVLTEFDQLGRPVYHMLGNHCLHNLPRPMLNQHLGIDARDDGSSYYSFQPQALWRVVVLDAYDVSILGWPPEHPRHERARNILEEKNPNKVKNSPEGLQGLDKRFVGFGGGVSEEQMQWLEGELQAARTGGQRVVVCGHLPLCPGTSPPTCLLWNYDQVLDLLRQFAPEVVATITGHAHQNGHIQDSAGIHHLVLPAVLETPPDRDCYGYLDVFENELHLRGVDTMMSLRMDLSSKK